MTGPTVASAAVEIVPSANHFFDDLRAKLLPQADKFGDQLGDSIGTPLQEKIRKSVGDGLNSGDATGKGTKSGSDFGDAFGKSLKTRLDAAFKTLPELDLKANVSQADAKLAEIRATLLGLNDQAYLDLHVDDATTLATIAELRAQLEDLSKNSPDIRVRVNAGAAAAELAALQAQIDKLNKGPGGPGNTGGALGGLGGSAAGAGGGIYQFLVPALIAASTIIGPLVATGVAGFGTILLGAKGLETQVESGLTPAFTQLEATATNALGPGINGALDELEQGLPKLTPLVTFFGNAIGQEVDKFATFLNNGGFQKFTTYAETELPIVENAFNSALEAGTSFFVAITPLGNALLITLTKVADVVGAISSGFNGIQNKFSGSTPAVTAPSTSKSNWSWFGGGFSKTGKAAGGIFGGIFSDIDSFIANGGSTSGSPNGQDPNAQAKAAAKLAAQIAAINANQAHSAGLSGGVHSDILDSSALANQANQLDGVTTAMAKANTEAASLALTMPKLAAQEQFAGLDAQGLASALDTFGNSTDSVADKAKLLGAVLVASQGDALSYAGAVAAGYGADSALIATFQSQAAAGEHTTAVVSSSAKDRVTAANAHLTASETKLAQVQGNSKSTAAQIAAANAAVASSKTGVDSATESLNKAASAATSTGIAFADTELGAINLNTGLIDLKSVGAGPLIQQLQAMQTAAEQAAEATYQHEVNTKGDSAALQDAQDIFESMTGGTLVANAKQLGLTGAEAKKLSDNYFSFDGKTVTTDVQAIGLNDINATLDQLGQQLSYLTKVPWNIGISVSATANDIGKIVHDAVNNINGAPAPNQPSDTQHAAGGWAPTGDGWGTAGEGAATEFFRKSGASLQFYSHTQSLAMAGGIMQRSAATASSQPLLPIHVAVQIDKKTIATAVADQNLSNGRRG